MAQRKNELDLTEIRAPMDGTVRNVRITTLGGVARAGEEIMQIVPADDDLIVEAKVKPADIAFVKPGLHATVDVDAYDYTSLRGRCLARCSTSVPTRSTRKCAARNRPTIACRSSTSAGKLANRRNGEGLKSSRA